MKDGNSQPVQTFTFDKNLSRVVLLRATKTAMGRPRKCPREIFQASIAECDRRAEMQQPVNRGELRQIMSSKLEEAQESGNFLGYSSVEAEQVSQSTMKRYTKQEKAKVRTSNAKDASRVYAESDHRSTLSLIFVVSATALRLLPVGYQDALLWNIDSTHFRVRGGNWEAVISEEYAKHTKHRALNSSTSKSGGQWYLKLFTPINAEGELGPLVAVIRYSKLKSKTVKLSIRGFNSVPGHVGHIWIVKDLHGDASRQIFKDLFVDVFLSHLNHLRDTPDLRGQPAVLIVDGEGEQIDTICSREVSDAFAASSVIAAKTAASTSGIAQPADVVRCRASPGAILCGRVPCSSQQRSFSRIRSVSRLVPYPCWTSSVSSPESNCLPVLKEKQLQSSVVSQPASLAKHSNPCT